MYDIVYWLLRIFYMYVNREWWYEANKWFLWSNYMQWIYYMNLTSCDLFIMIAIVNRVSCFDTLLDCCHISIHYWIRCHVWYIIGSGITFRHICGFNERTIVDCCIETNNHEIGILSLNCELVFFFSTYVWFTMLYFLIKIVVWSYRDIVVMYTNIVLGLSLLRTGHLQDATEKSQLETRDLPDERVSWLV